MDDKPKIVFVVEDENEIRTLIESNLMSRGFKVLTAVNGKHALQKLQSGARIDLILCDWKMPIMSGLEFLQETRKTKGYESTPFIMVTALREKPSVIAAAKSGVTDYVVKPFKTAELIQKIEALIGVPKVKPEDSEHPTEPDTDS